MTFLLGGATTLALVLLIIAATVGLSRGRLRELRQTAWLMSIAIASLVTAPDLVALASVALPAVALYEVVVQVAG